MYKKYYPYLLNNYYHTTDSANRNDIPSSKEEFLDKLDNLVNQRRYAKIILLDWDENPIKELQGVIQSGNISKDGSSSVRRTASLTTSVEKGSYDINSLQVDYSINKMVFVEIGIKNESGMWNDYPILWFPQGIFFITAASISSSTSSAVSLSLTLTDKMSMLNGTIGGAFPAPVVLDTADDADALGRPVQKKVLIYDIIRELVHHYGGEPLENIIIENVPKRIKQRCSWCQNYPLYIGTSEGRDLDNNKTVNYICYLNKVADNLQEVKFGQPAGFVLTDFVYRGDLTVNAGETIASALDKIKSVLGNYEYFYDEYGLFHFREVRNYLNTTFATTFERELKENDYLFDRIPSETEYEFSDAKNLVSINRSPNFANIKNDYLVYGYQELTNSSIQRQLLYHLAVDRKPVISSFNHILFYKHPLDKQTHAYSCSWDMGNLARPANGKEIDANRIYVEGDKGYMWYNNDWKEVELVSTYYLSHEYVPQNWQTQLYMEAVSAHGLETSYYAQELKAFWPGTCLFVPVGASSQEIPASPSDRLIHEEILPLNEAKYYLDFLDDVSSFGQYNVSNIGRRTLVSNDKDVNCLAEQEPPDFCFIDNDKSVEEQNQEKLECKEKFNSKWTQVPHNIYSQLSLAGFEKGALEELKYQLYLHTSYQNNLSLNSIPNFWLEPNTCVSISDETTSTFGSYMVAHVNIPLDVGSTMSVNCVENVSRVY